MFVKALKTAGKLLLLLVALIVSVMFAAIFHSAVLYPMYLESQAKLGMEGTAGACGRVRHSRIPPSAVIATTQPTSA